MDSIGEKLRQERVRRGLDIEGIAERTKINPSLLLAIENNDLSKLPGTFFTRSFVRQYARALGLDEREFESELGPPAGEPAAPEAPAAERSGAAIHRRDRIRLEPLKSSRGIRAGFAGQLIAFILVLAICSAVYSFWQKNRAAQSRAEQAQTQARQKPKPATPAPPAAVPAPPADQAAAAAAAAGMPAVPGQVVLTPASTGVPATTTPAATPQPAATESASSVPVRVEFRATEAAWVRVTADGKVLFIGTIEPGQSKAFDATSALRIRTGNAGGIEATWNGKTTGPLGPAGQVRDVEFTPSAFRVVPPAPKPPAESKPPEEIKQLGEDPLGF